MAVSIARSGIPKTVRPLDILRDVLGFLRSAYFWLTDPFRRIPFRLWRAYLFTTIIATLVVEAAICGLAALFYPQIMQSSVTQESRTMAGQLRQLYAHSAPSALSLTEALDAQCAQFSLQESTIMPFPWLFGMSPTMVATDKNGTVLASAPGVPYLVGKPLGPQLPGEEAAFFDEGVRDGPAGFENTQSQLQESAFDTASAYPLTGPDGRMLGYVFTRIEPAGHGLSQDMLTVASVFSVVGLLAMIPVDALSGILLAGVYGRKLSRRIVRLSSTVDAWSNGDLNGAIPDRSRDEIGRLAQALNSMAHGLSRYVITRQRLAAAEERSRVARNLHDTVKQQAFAAAMQLGVARIVLEEAGGPALVFVTNAERLANKVQEELMSIIHALHPDILVDPDRPLSAILQEYASDWSLASGISIEVQTSDDFRASPETIKELVLIVHEALSNVERHSEATGVHLAAGLDNDDGLVHIAIADNGRGFDPIFRPRGMGLHSMRDRAASLPGGSLSVATAPGKGVVVRLVFAPEMDANNGENVRARSGQEATIR